MPPDQNPERTDVVADLEEIAPEKWRADIPLVVLTHGRAIGAQAFPNITPEQAARIEDLWLELPRDLAGRSSQGRLVIAEKSGHGVHYEEAGLVIQAIRLARVRRERSRRRLADELEVIAEHGANLPVLDARSADEILGYDEHGLPR